MSTAAEQMVAPVAPLVTAPCSRDSEEVPWTLSVANCLHEDVNSGGADDGALMGATLGFWSVVSV